jgi:hypothetical protein
VLSESRASNFLARIHIELQDDIFPAVMTKDVDPVILIGLIQSRRSPSISRSEENGF